MTVDRLLNACSPYRFFWGTCCFLLIINLAGYTLIIKNQQKDILNFQNLYSAKRKESVSLSKKNDSAVRYHQIKESLTIFRDRLPAMENIADQVKQIKDIVNKHGLSAEKLIFKPDREDIYNLWKYSASFSVDGHYSKLKTFLADIQNLRSIFCIDGLSMSRSNGTKHVKMRLSLSTYCK